jgi:hypothetical protein
MSTYRGLDYIGVSRMKGSRASDRSERVNRTGMEERVFSLYLTRETRARACVDLKGPSLFLISLPAASRWIGNVSSSFVVRRSSSAPTHP